MHQSHLRKLEWLWFNSECYHAVMWYWDLLLFGVPTLQIGDKLPSVQVMEGTPKDKVNVATLFSGKKGVLFAVPGAFTPGCSKVCVECYVQWFVTEKWGENIILVLKCGRDVDRKVLTVRNWLTIMNLFTWWSFSLFLWPQWLIQEWYGKEEF